MVAAPRPGSPTKWTFEAIQQEASLYPTRSAFKKGSTSAYSTAQKKGWLDQVCPHMVAAPRPGAPTKWTFESTHKEALNYETRSEFAKGSQSAYQTAQRNGWLDQVCPHMVAATRPGAPTKWTFEAVQQQAFYSTRTAFQKGSTSAYQTAQKNGWLDAVCSHMQRKVKWTFEAIQQEASLHTTRTAFRKDSPSAYQTARKNGWLDAACTHMKKSVCAH